MQTSTRIMQLLKKQFARYGIPRVIASDGGSQFTSQEFKAFVKNWGISHISSSPMYQRANGKAESAVKIMKSLLIKTWKEKGDPYQAMMEQWNSPRQDTNRSPVKMMFNRSTRSFTTSLSNNAKELETKRKAWCSQAQCQEISRSMIKKTLRNRCRTVSIFSAHQRDLLWNIYVLLFF